MSPRVEPLDFAFQRYPVLMCAHLEQGLLPSALINDRFLHLLCLCFAEVTDATGAATEKEVT